jgi:hypothetical protein
MTSLVQVTRGGCIAWDGRALGMIVTVAMGIAMVLSPATCLYAPSPVPCMPSRLCVPAMGPMRARRDVPHGPGASLDSGLAGTDQRGDTPHDHARPVPSLPGVDDVDGRGVGRWA